jgi:prevent-host-death family protein
VIVNATDLKNNLGKYLRASAREDIIITSNGRKIARLTAIENTDNAALSGSHLKEKAEAYVQFPRKATFEEFLQLTENCDEHEQYEYIDGEIYLLASPRAAHQQILGELHGIFYNWFRGKQCRPMLSPFDIKLRRFENDNNVVQPDLMVICDLEEKLNEKNYYDGVPALVVEILSESSLGKDLVKKLDLYMSAGIREYWIVNPFNREVTIFMFENNDVAKSVTYKNDEEIVSFIFDGLKAGLRNIFI